MGIGERVLKENAGFKSKICSNCEKIKNDDDFYRNSSQCKECIKAYKMVTRQEKQVPREKGIVVAPSQYMEVFREVVADYMKTLSEDDDRNTKQVTAYEIMCWIEERRKEENEKIERPVQKKKP